MTRVFAALAGVVVSFAVSAADLKTVRFGCDGLDFSVVPAVNTMSLFRADRWQMLLDKPIGIVWRERTLVASHQSYFKSVVEITFTQPIRDFRNGDGAQIRFSYEVEGDKLADNEPMTCRVSL